MVRCLIDKNHAQLRLKLRKRLGTGCSKHLHLTESVKKDFFFHTLFVYMDANIIRKQLDQGLIGSDKLLAGTKLLDESSREAGDYTDIRYLPFYYHLGKQLTPKSVYQIGAKLGLVGACFLRSCKTVEQWIAMDQDRDLAARIIESNLKLHTKYCNDPMPGGSVGYMGLSDSMLEMPAAKDFPGFDLGFLTENFGSERYIKHLKFLWNFLSPEGLLVADYINSGDVFHEFCRVNNREPEIFNTRYGVGIIQK